MTWGPLFEFYIGIKSDMIKITRKTDSLIDLLADTGGFMRALRVIGQILIFSYNAYALKTTLAQNLVRFVPSQHLNSDKNSKIGQKIR